MSGRDRSKRVDTGRKDDLGRPIYNWIKDNDITPQINVMEKELVPENNHSFGYSTLEWSDIKSLTLHSGTFYVQSLEEQEELEILKNIIKENDCSNKKEVVKSIDSIIKDIDNENYDNNDLLSPKRNPGDIFGIRKDMSKLKNKLLNIKEKVKNDTSQNVILVSNSVIKEQGFYSIVSRNNNYPTIRKEWENYVNNMGKIFNYYLSDPELNNSVRKISAIIDTQARDNIAHNIYDLDYDNARKLAVEYDTEFFDIDSTGWEIANRNYYHFDLPSDEKKIISDMIINGDVNTLTINHNRNMSKILDNFHANCAPIETTMVSLKDIRKAREENSQYTFIIPLSLEDKKKIDNYCNSNSFSRMFNNEEVEIINPGFNYVETLNDIRSEDNSDNGSLINKYIQEAYYELEDNDPVKWFDYENIVNIARELGKTRDGVYSDLQKSYIVQQKTKKFIEKMSEEKSRAIEEKSMNKHIMRSVQEELSRDINNITRSNDYVEELFDL